MATTGWTSVRSGCCRWLCHAGLCLAGHAADPGQRWWWRPRSKARSSKSFWARWPASRPSSTSGTNGGGFFSMNAAPVREPDAFEQCAAHPVHAADSVGADGDLWADAGAQEAGLGVLRRLPGDVHRLSGAGLWRRAGGQPRAGARRADQVAAAPSPAATWRATGAALALPTMRCSWRRPRQPPPAQSTPYFDSATRLWAASCRWRR